MKPIFTFTVTPSLPAPLNRFRDLAYNMRWSWNHDTIELYRRLDRDLWETSGHNPVLMLGTIDQAQLQAAATDEGFLAHLERVSRDFEAYLTSKSTWFQRTHSSVTPTHPSSHTSTNGLLVAYFSAEFGLTDCLSIFAGGLGVLAGDHLKSASDLGVPVVGIGLLYQQGYFQQYLNEAGWQQEVYEDNDFYNLPIILERRTDGTPLTISVSYPGRQVFAQIWRVQVGRVPLYLLDTNISINRPEDQNITDQLYGGDLEMRIKQEIILSIGGYRALQALNLEPNVYHMNEGHSAFLALERTRHLMETQGLSFVEAREVASAGLIFTTHTSVPAGHDYFSPELMEYYFKDYIANLRLSQREALALGRQDPNNDNESFCMTVLALRMAQNSNGVSRLHGQVSRRMWQALWPGILEEEVPISHVTNGVHFQSWISQEMDELYDRYLGLRWREEPADQAVWQRVERIPAEELWRTLERRRERLIVFTRRRLRSQLERRGVPRVEVEAADEVLDPKALTIGFARRFATYKRATLLLRDPDRLARILSDPARPVQIIYAGEAHPRDNAGKELIQQIVHLARQKAFRNRLVFLEDYDMAIARYLVQGCDVWLNTPRRPLEASGTSGMKAAANGALNLSTLDGWWAEAWEYGSVGVWERESMGEITHTPTLPYSHTPIGWAIGRGEIYDNPAYQDQIEAETLYNLLEQEVVPIFYDQGANGLPRRWINRVKASLGTLCHFFNTHRMVREYTERFYLPAAVRYQKLTADGMTRAKVLAAWKARVQENWTQVRFETVETGPLTELQVGNQIHARAQIHLGALTPEDVRVEFYLGLVDADNKMREAQVTPMKPVRLVSEGRYLFEANPIPCCKSGLHGCTVRIRPDHPDLMPQFLPGLIVWAGPEVKVQ
jgi:starch phosphorylase